MPAKVPTRRISFRSLGVRVGQSRATAALRGTQRDHRTKPLRLPKSQRRLI